MKENFKIGQKVWFLEYWSQMPKCATIVSFETIKPDKERTVAKLHWDDGGTNSMLVEDLYSTKEELLCAEKEKSRKRIEKFKEEIKDVKDLIQFMFDKTITFDNNADYAFYVHDQSKVNIFGYLNKLSSNKEISKELFFKNTNFVESKVKWEQLFEKIKDSTYRPEDIEKILKL